MTDRSHAGTDEAGAPAPTGAHADTPQEDGPSWGRRLARTLGALAVLLVLLMTYGIAVEPRLILSVERETVTIPGLGDGWEGATVGVISDLQVGLWWDNVGMARRAVETLVEEDPEAVLLLGDFVYGADDTTENARTAVDVVRPLTEAGIPTFAVLGNHDHSAGAAEELRTLLEDAGIQLLHNEATTVESAGDVLHIVGVGPHRPDEARPEEALKEVPAEAARVVMMHNPATFDRMPGGTAPLAVAGHTHGGQMRVPFAPQWSYLGLIEDHPVRADGWIHGYGEPGNQLYVNRGIGMSLIPARINCSPAITLFTLAGAAPEGTS